MVSATKDGKMSHTRVLLADDHALIMAGVRSALGPQFEIVGEAGDGSALLRAAETLRPDLVILDISMPVLNGLESARRIRKILPTARLIFLSQHNDPAYLREALKIGATGYVLKSEAGEVLSGAAAAVMRGETYISPGFGEPVIAGLWNRCGEINNESADLTARQREILQLILEGRANKEIADLLHLSVKTIEFHRARIMTKLGVGSAAQLAKVAVQRGLIAE